MTYGNAPRTQAEWDRKRAEEKAEAAVTVKKEAQKAARRKKDFLNRNKPEHEVILDTTEVQEAPDKSVDLEVAPANAEQTHPAERYPAPVTADASAPVTGEGADKSEESGKDDQSTEE